MDNWLEYHYGFRDGKACKDLGLVPGDTSQASVEYQRGYLDALKESKRFLNENYQPPRD